MWDREVSFHSALSEVPRSYRGRNANPDEHPKWIADNELRKMRESGSSGSRVRESPKAFEYQWLENLPAGGPVLRACTP